MNGRIDGFQVYAEYALYSDSLSLFMAQEPTGGGQLRILQPIEPEIRTEIGQGLTVRDPSLVFSRKQATAIMEEMWKLGIRPPGITNEADVIVLLKEHLADMRKELERAHTVIRELNHIIAENGERH